MGLGLLLRLLPDKTGPDAPWRSGLDLGLALLFGAVSAGLSAFWMGNFFINNAPVAASDFAQYCDSVGAFRDADLQGWRVQRSVVAGWLPSVLASSLGVVDGLLAAAVISAGVTGAGVYLWARALHSRLAGMSAALLTCAVAPLVLLTRTASFYPQVVAGFVLSATGAALALRYRSLWSLLAAGLGVGLVLLVDVRGLIWALPALGLGLLAAVSVKGWGRRALGLAALLLPLWASYQLGPRAYLDGAPSLERQAMNYVDHALQSSGQRGPQELHGSGRFVWGRSPLHRLPATLGYLRRLNADLPAELAQQPATVLGRQTQVLPWLLPGLVGLLLAAWGLRRRPLLLAGLVGGGLPFAVALRGATTLVYHPRFIANGLVLIPVLLGLGLAVLAQGALARQDRTRPRWRVPWRPLAGVALVLALVLGGLPSWLSPVAAWRSPILADEEPAHSLRIAQGLAPPHPEVTELCLGSLRTDLDAGHPAGSWLYGWQVGPRSGP